MNEVTFFIPGTPQGKERPRITKRGAYTPQKTKDYENEIACIYQENYGDFSFPDDVPLEIEITALFKKKPNSQKTYPIDKDWDNIGKIICDALNKVAYNDDRMIMKGEVKKFYSDREGVWIRLRQYHVISF